MTQRLLLLTATLLFGQLTIAQITVSKFAYQKFSADTVIHTIDDWTKELSIKHPGFYRYNTKTDFTRFIDSIKSTIKDSLTQLETYQKLKPIISNIHCLHTGLNFSKEYGEYINNLPNLFPFKLYFIDNKAYVVKNYSENRVILPGDEILSINGQSIQYIILQLLPLMPADGYNVTMKYRALYFQFPSWYRLLGTTENYSVVSKHGEAVITSQIKGATFNDLAEDGFLKEPKRPKQLEFKIENNVGFLTIHSFAKSAIKQSNQDFIPFIDKAFAQLKQNGIQNLIVDVRDNTGGSDPYAAYFTSYFFDKPFRYWDRIEVTEAIAKEIKRVALKLFYRKPVQKDGAWLWQKARHTSEFDFYEEQQPAKNNYKGNTYVLINGFCMSSCSDVTAILSYSKKATFIGEETGGGYQGNNSGMIPETKVTPYNFTISVPLQAYFNHLDTSKNIGRGTMPDFAIMPTIDDIIKGENKELNFAIQLIGKQ